MVIIFKGEAVPCFFGLLDPEDGTDRLPRNVGTELPFYVAWTTRTATAVEAWLHAPLFLLKKGDKKTTNLFRPKL
jgi:hypothetical protein